MAGTVNKSILVGNVGKDPEIRKTKRGDEYATFSVATSETWRDKVSGERKEDTTWHNITVYNEGLVKVAKEYVKKGSKVYIEGKFETYQYAKDGRDAWGHHVVLKGFSAVLTLLTGRGEGDGREDARAPKDDRDFGRRSGGSGGSASGGAPSDQRELDDDIPF